MSAGGLYEIDDVAGGGAHAIVCFGRVRGRDERVALKVLRPQHQGNAPLRARFTDEARILLPIHHPEVVRVYRLLDYGGRPVIEMEPVEGVSTEVLIGSGHPLPLPVALEITRLAADALHAVYEGPYGPDGAALHVVHRDVKPANLLLSRSGHVKVADFGIAKGDFDGRRAKSLFSVPGSPGYVAPERLVALADGPAADVYALGVTLFQLVTGKALVLSREADQADDAARRQLVHVPDPALAALIGRMVAHDPDARPGMGEVGPALATLLGDRPPDLAAYAQSAVVPILERRRGRSLAEDLSVVRFLENERPSDAPRPLSPAETRAAVRRHLGTPGWESRVPELERIVTASSGGFEAPLLDVLDRAAPAWWTPWVRPAKPEELAAALWVLGDHPTPAVVARARRLASHGDDRVARAARFLVARG